MGSSSSRRLACRIPKRFSMSRRNFGSLRKANAAGGTNPASVRLQEQGITYADPLQQKRYGRVRLCVIINSVILTKPATDWMAKRSNAMSGSPSLPCLPHRGYTGYQVRRIERRAGAGAYLGAGAPNRKRDLEDDLFICNAVSHRGWILRIGGVAAFAREGAKETCSRGSRRWGNNGSGHRCVINLFKHTRSRWQLRMEPKAVLHGAS